MMKTLLLLLGVLASACAGETGPAGEQGPPGEPGTVGERGEQGDTGETGEQGEQGQVGPEGPGVHHVDANGVDVPIRCGWAGCMITDANGVWWNVEADGTLVGAFSEQLYDGPNCTGAMVHSTISLLAGQAFTIDEDQGIYATAPVGTVPVASFTSQSRANGGMCSPYAVTTNTRSSIQLIAEADAVGVERSDAPAFAPMLGMTPN